MTRAIHSYSEHLHEMKALGTPTRSVESLTRSRSKVVEVDEKKRIIQDSYRKNPYVTSLISNMDRHMLYCEFLGCEGILVQAVKEIVDELRDPGKIVTYNSFKIALDELVWTLKEIDKDLKKKVGRITCEECNRLDEAIICFENQCNYASVVMAVSSVELRLHKMIENADRKLYKANFKEATLGTITKVFDDNEYKAPEFAKVKKLLPRKHKPLIALLNQYRIFSAHEKGESITSQNAETVLHLSFAFMTDATVCPYNKGSLACDSAEPDKRKSSRTGKRKSSKH